MTLDMNTTALLITDPQRDVLASDGVLADLLHAQVAQRQVVANLRKLRDAAEAAGLPILYSTLIQRNEHHAAPPSNAPIYQLLRQRGAMREGAGGAIVEALAPTPSTVLATPRAGMLAFGTTDLDQLLRARGIRTLIMGGMVLNLCVEANVRAAVDHGYEVVLVSDATATTSDEAHAGTLATLSLIAQRIVETSELLAELNPSAAA